MKGATRDRSQKDDIRRVSIHAPLARCDFIFDHPFPGLSMFQSTHLLRGATQRQYQPCFRPGVSIHAPLARCDSLQFSSRLRGDVSIHAPLARCDHVWHCSLSRTRCFNPRTSCEVRPAPILGFRQLTRFNPRTSCEVRRIAATPSEYNFTFQSTHLLRGATDQRERAAGKQPVSIHAPLARCDLGYGWNILN